MTAVSDYHLSPREQDVARLLLAGLGDKLIAKLLTVQTQQIRKHMSHILRKTNSANRTAAALRLAGYN